MPIYVYKHPTEERYEEVVQGMNDPHTFSKEGIEWQRVFLSPNAAISTAKRKEIREEGWRRPHEEKTLRKLREKSWEKAYRG